MKRLEARQLEGFKKLNDQAVLEFHPIKIDNWDYNANVTADFAIGYDSQHIFLRYKVRESHVRARYKNTHDPVYEDSCVEFFISFEKDYYYNLEFNCIGTMLGAYGKSREDRIKLDKELLESVRIIPSLGNSKIQIVNRETLWTLDICIPASVFKYSDLDSFNNKTALCNFYKCGDGLEQPHYLSWEPITSKKPDFHRPECFGELNFK